MTSWKQYLWSNENKNYIKKLKISENLFYCVVFGSPE